MDFQTVKKTVSKMYYTLGHENKMIFFIDCGCNREGSTSLICNKTDGQCKCKANDDSRQCEKCQDGFKLHPNCTGKVNSIDFSMRL